MEEVWRISWCIALVSCIIAGLKLGLQWNLACLVSCRRIKDDFLDLDRFARKCSSIEQEVLASVNLAAFNEPHRLVDTSMTIYQPDSFCIFFELIVGSFHSDSVDSGQVKLHGRILVVTF